MDITAILALIIGIVAIVALIFLLPGLTGAPYVPTLKKSVEIALTKLYPVKKGDLLIDLGAGDGVVLYTATKHGAKALGLEINPILTLIAKWRFRKNRNITMRCRNFYHYRFPDDTTVVYAFAVSLHIKKIRRKIEDEATRIGKPIYFISNAFNLKDIKPEKQLDSFYLYKITPRR
jgi:ubiquinone/menaquinone biosynthesis C-methylase UbiE